MHAPSHGKHELNALLYTSEMLHERHHGILKPKLKVMEPKSITGILHHYHVQSQEV